MLNEKLTAGLKLAPPDPILAAYHTEKEKLVELLYENLRKAIKSLNSEATPLQEQTSQIGVELVRIAEKMASLLHDTGADDRKEFEDLILENWSVLQQLIKRRLFRDINSGDVLVNIGEVDYLHMDSLVLLKIGKILPGRDFELLSILGDFLCEIYGNLSNYVETRISELESMNEQPLQAALLRKEILDILRVRAYRHKNCCNNFLDVICLQDAFKITSMNALKQMLTQLQKKQLYITHIEGTETFLAGTEKLFSNSQFAKSFCQTDVSSSSSMHADILVIFNKIDGFSEVLSDFDNKLPCISESSILAKYAEHSSKETITMVTKSTIQLRLLVKEITTIEGVQRCESFRGLNLTNNGKTFVQLREKLFGYLGNICGKMLKIGGQITDRDLHILQENGVGKELERSLYVASTFVFEFLIEIPFEMSFLQKTFEDFIDLLNKWLPICLEVIIGGDVNNSHCWYYMIKALELLNPLLLVGIYQHPSRFKRMIKELNKLLYEFSCVDMSLKNGYRKNYIMDLGSYYIAKMSGEQPEIKQAPASLRFPDQSTLELKGFWVFCLLGSSSGKLIYKCLDQRSRKLVVIKRLDKSKLLNSSLTKGELGTLMTLSHTNIVRYLDCFEDDKHWFMVMEYCEDSVVYRANGNNAKFDEAEARKIIRQVLYGLSYLHSDHIVHRDIKPENLLMDGRGFVKIADFGEAQLAPHSLMNNNSKFDLSSLHGTPAYMAPECLKVANVLPSADIWSLGCVLLYLVTGERPWKQFQSSYSILFALCSDEEQPADVDSLSCSSDCKRVLRSVLKNNPEERPSVSELLSDSYFSDVPESII